MKILLFLLFTFFSVLNCVHSQNVKNYTGDFNTKSYPGKCTYSYYEDSLSKIVKHGSFSFNANGKNAFNESVSVKITGKYEHGKPIGSWSFSIISPQVTESVSGAFIAGEQNGIWSFQKKSKFDNENKNGTITFAKGNITDFKITSTGNSWSNNFYIVGKANEQNYLTGEVKMEYKYRNISIKESRFYKNGKIYKQSVDDKQTGEMIYKKNMDSVTTNIINQLENGIEPIDIGFEFTGKKCEIDINWFNDTRVEPCALVNNLIYNSIVQEISSIEFKQVGVKFLTKTKTRSEIEEERTAEIKRNKDRTFYDLKIIYPSYSTENLEAYSSNIGEILLLMKEIDYEYNKHLSKGLNNDRLIFYKKYERLSNILVDDMNSSLDSDIQEAIKKSDFIKGWITPYKGFMKKEFYTKDFFIEIDKKHLEIEEMVKIKNK